MSLGAACHVCGRYKGATHGKIRIYYYSVYQAACGE